MDLLVEALDPLMALGIRLVIVGSGDRLMEGAFLSAQTRHPGRIGVRIGYDEGLAHRVQGGADALIVPSRFEPCGLTQLCALRYGSIPVVSHVGGLADTVIDANFAGLAAGVATGLIFSPVSAPALVAAVERLRDLYDDTPLWRDLQASAMGSDVSWAASARLYADLYAELLRTDEPK